MATVGARDGHWMKTEALRARRAAARPAALRWLVPSEPRLTDAGLKAIEHHKYHPGPCTSLDDWLYKVWWLPLSEKVPLNIAPNTITAVGSFLAILSTVLLWCRSSTDEGSSTHEGNFDYLELFVAFLIIVYQTCDALDGLQARRTGAGSPLGELMDHGCDALCVSALTLGYSLSMKNGLGINTCWSLATSWIPFWLAQWEAFHTGQLMTGTGGLGITEIELLVAGLHLFTGLLGPAVWRIVLLDLPGVLPADGRLEVRHLNVIIQAVFCVILIRGVGSRTLALAKNSAHRRDIAMGAWPIVLIAVTAVAWPFLLPGLHMVPLVFLLVTFFSRSVLQQIVANTTMELSAQPLVVMFPLPAFLAMGVCGLLDGLSGSVCIWLYAALSAVECLAFIADVVDEIATHLNINVFSVEKRRD